MKENQYGYSDLEWGAMTLDEKIATERFFEIQELRAEVKEARNAALSEAIDKIRLKTEIKLGCVDPIIEILEGLKKP